MAFGGFLALLDDVAIFTTKFAATAADDIAAASKIFATGVDDVAMMTQAGVRGSAAIIVDDIPVSADAVSRNMIDPKRELPIIWRILRNAQITRLVVTPVTMVVSIFAPTTMPLVLGIGGCYLAFEGAEKCIHGLLKHDADHDGIEDENEGLSLLQIENKLVRDATRTDVIMGTEISFMACKYIDEIMPEVGWMQKSIALLFTNTGIAVFIYGLVGGLVKMDDVGLHLLHKKNKCAQWIGPKLILLAPRIAKTLAYVGTTAMLWIGGELIVPGIATAAEFMGLQGLAGAAHSVLHSMHDIPHVISSIFPTSLSLVANFLGWLSEVALFGVVGFVAGAILIAGFLLGQKALGAFSKKEP